MKRKAKLTPTSAPRVIGKARSLKLSITEDDITNGLERDPNCCVIACALKRAHPELSHVSVDIATIRATNKDRRERYIWYTPRSLQSVIVATDQGNKDKIRPGSVSLLGAQMLQLPPSGKSRSRKSGKRQRPAAKKRRLSRGGGGNNVPLVVGGIAPPKFLGQMRAFGARGLKV